MSSLLSPRGSRVPWLLMGILIVSMLFPACSDDESDEPGDGGTNPGTVGASIEGVVTNLDGNELLPGVEVTVQPWFADPVPAKENPAILAATRTDARGRFVLDGLSAGQYLLVVDGSTLVSPFDPSWAFALQTVGFEVATNEARRLEDPIRLLGWSLNEGELYDGLDPVEIGTPFVTLRLGVGNVVYPVQARDRILYLSLVPPDLAAATLPAGVYPSFVGTLLPQGTRFDMPVATEFESPWSLGEGTTLEVHALDPARNAFRLAGTVRYDLDTGRLLPEEPFLDRATQFYLLPPVFDLNGRIVHDTEGPLQDVLVEIVPEFNFSSVAPPCVEGLSVRTDSNGDFTITGARVAHPMLHVAWTGMDGSYELYESIPEGGGELETLQLTEPNRVTVTVEGTVTDAQGAPIAGAQVGIWPAGIRPLDDKFLVDPAPPTRNLYTTLSDAEGAYRFESVILDYEVEYELSASFREGTGAYGYTWFTTPGFDGNGATLTEDLVLCDSMGPCGQPGSWSLEGNLLTLTNDYEMCFGGEESPSNIEYEVLALSDGVIVLDPVDGPDNWIYERVGETGPDGVSAENLPGLYRVRQDVALKDSGAQYLLMLPNGRMRYWFSEQSDAGTYAIDGTSLMLTELWPEAREAEAYGYVLSGDRLTIYQGSTMLYRLERCVLGDGTTIEGIWVSDDPYDWPEPTVVFHAGEYVFLQGGMMIIADR